MTARSRPHQPQTLTNREGMEAFAVEWDWATGPTARGFTAVLRVKNEARNLPYVLPPLLRTVEKLLLVDNQSTDGTAAVAMDIAKERKLARKLHVVDYPFAVARCGSEHLRTPPDSVHSLTYFYNWGFSQVQTGYALKWDGDMVLSVEGERAMSDLTWRIETVEAVLAIPRVPVWVVSGSEAFVDTSLRNVEPWAWPNKEGYWFGKGLEWEIQLRPDSPQIVTLPDWSCFEVKWLDEDEFAHWTMVQDFEDAVRTSRKRREWEVCAALTHGRVPEGLLHVTSEGTRHVVDMVRELPVSEWRRRVRG